MDCRRTLRWVTVRLLSALLVAALVASALYAAELGFRLADPQRRLPPCNQYIDGVRYSWGQPIHRNRLGFRSREIGLKPSGAFRIMVLGDSMTWGAGIAAEQRYTDILEQRLNADFQTHKFEVHNFGVSGGPMILHARILQNYIGIVQPDLIVVGFCYNDTDTNMKRPSGWCPEKQRFDDKCGPFLERMSGCLTRLHLAHIGVRTERAVRRIAELCGVYPDSISVIDRTYDPNSAEWRTFVRALERIKYISDTCGLPPPVFASLNHGVYLRTPTDYARPDPLVSTFLRWHRQAEIAAGTQGYIVVNFHQEIADRLKGRSLVVNPLDNHPSPALHQLYADTLHPIVRTIVEREGRLATETPP